jgi:hypothetical protein
MGSIKFIFKLKLVCIFTRRTSMEQLKRKEIKEEEVVCSYSIKLNLSSSIELTFISFTTSFRVHFQSI